MLLAWVVVGEMGREGAITAREFLPWSVFGRNLGFGPKMDGANLIKVSAVISVGL